MLCISIVSTGTSNETKATVLVEAGVVTVNATSAQILKNFSAKLRAPKAQKTNLTAERRNSTKRRPSNDLRRLSLTLTQQQQISESEIPTKDVQIAGQQMKLVVHKDLDIVTNTKLDPPASRLKLDWV